MTIQEMMAFVQRGYDAYNAHEFDPHWLGYTDTDVAEVCEVIDIPSGMVLRGPKDSNNSLTFSTAFPDSREVTVRFCRRGSAARPRLSWHPYRRHA